MQSALTWIDHDAQARERSLRILSLFQEKNSRDELGLGAVRDSFADQLFPGVSTIQTRLRYMLFVPWIYRALEEKQCPAAQFAQEADKCERGLVQPLMASADQAGVFGKSAGNTLKRLPSAVYWSGLGTWGIRLTPFSQDEYHRRIEESYRQRRNLQAQVKEAQARGDDMDAMRTMENSYNWHSSLPAPPSNFPAQVDFILSREEAEFICDRIQSECADSLLAFLTLQGQPADTAAPWLHPDYHRFSAAHQELLTHARLFSEVMHGAALSYNIQLAKLRGNDELLGKHQASFERWLARLPKDEIRDWSLERLWVLTHVPQKGNIPAHSISQPTRQFVEKWCEYVRQSPGTLLDNEAAQRLIRQREERLKGARSRFRNPRALEQWGGYSGVGRLVYRWPNVKVLLNDLYQGLQREKTC